MFLLLLEQDNHSFQPGLGSSDPRHHRVTCTLDLMQAASRVAVVPADDPDHSKTPLKFGAGGWPNRQHVTGAIDLKSLWLEAHKLPGRQVIQLLGSINYKR